MNILFFKMCSKQGIIDECKDLSEGQNVITWSKQETGGILCVNRRLIQQMGECSSKMQKVLKLVRMKERNKGEGRNTKCC